MQRLQLAEPSYLSEPGMLSDFDIDEYYVSVPTDDGGVIRVREDYFDDYDDDEYEQVMNMVEPYNGRSLNGLFSGVRERMTERRETRKAKKAVDPETGLTGKQSFKLQKQAGRGDMLKNVVGGITDFFGKKQDPLTKQFDVGGNVDFGYQNQPTGMSGNTKTLLYVGGGALLLFGLYKIMK
jgi:hypothetical protein